MAYQTNQTVKYDSTTDKRRVAGGTLAGVLAGAIGLGIAGCASKELVTSDYSGPNNQISQIESDAIDGILRTLAGIEAGTVDVVRKQEGNIFVRKN